MHSQKKAEAIKDLFSKVFGPVENESFVVGRAPGRVNLIGEHTDYNDGFVFPMAIDFDMILAARKRNDRTVRIYSADFDQTVEFSVTQPIGFDSDKRWSNYLRGVLAELMKQGAVLPGMDMVFQGNVPQGAGLSSSAALEVVTASVVQKLCGSTIAPPDLALLCQQAENKFVGMNCGIMDQFISMMGRKDQALFLDCRSLEYRHVPLALGDYRILICQSGVKHNLVDSKYNERRRQCEQGVAVLAGHFPGIRALRDASLEQLEICRAEMDDTVYKRCRHVIAEDQRVLDSIKALEQNDLNAFGRLMNGSHDSLRDLYEVSCDEIDLLVKLAREVTGVLGSRITGGGFGGCTVNLVAETAVEDFERHVATSYRARTGIEPQFFISTAANGAEILE